MAELRVVSLLPQFTDTVIALGKHQQLVGISHECDSSQCSKATVLTQSKIQSSSLADVDADMARQLTTLATQAQELSCGSEILENVLSPYKTDMELLKQLKPDVIITSIETLQDCVQLDDIIRTLNRVMERTIKVVNIQTHNFEDCVSEIAVIGAALGSEASAGKLQEEVRYSIECVKQISAGRKRPRVLMLQWIDPLLSTSAWGPECVNVAGGISCAGEVSHPTALSIDQLKAIAPDIIVFTLCGLTIAQTRKETREWLKSNTVKLKNVPAVRNSRVVVTDGVRVFQRTGQGISVTCKVLSEIIHSEAQGFGLKHLLWDTVTLEATRNDCNEMPKPRSPQGSKTVVFQR